MPTEKKIMIGLLIAMVLVGLIGIAYVCQPKQCPSCGNKMSVFSYSSINYCNQCSAPLQDICPNCGEKKYDTPYCPGCGNKYEDHTTATGYCSNCGEECASPYCPHCGTKQEND